MRIMRIHHAFAGIAERLRLAVIRVTPAVFLLVRRIAAFITAGIHV